MAKAAREKRWAAENNNKRRTRRANFRVENQGNTVTRTQKYSMKVDVEELTDPPVYVNTYTTKARWRDGWTPEETEAPQEDPSL